MKFIERIEFIKQYQDGLVTFLEFCVGMQMNAAEVDAVVLLQAAHADMAMSANQCANTMDDMVEKQDLGLHKIPKLVY